MGMKVEITVLGEKQISRELLRISESAGNLIPAWEVIFEFFEKIEEAQFESQGAQSGNPWPALAESTKARKASASPPLDPRIMHATLALRRSLTDSSHDSAVRYKSPHLAVFGTTEPQGQWHQMPSPTAPYPRRRSIDFTELQKQNAVKIIQLWVMRGVARMPGRI